MNITVDDIESLSSLLRISQKTLETNFPRTKQNFLKRGILIEKFGWGKYAEYCVSDLFEGSEMLDNYLKNK